MTYFQWMLKTGWKNYIIPFVIIIFIDYGIYRSYEDLMAQDWIAVVLQWILIVATNVGIIYHSILTYKKSKE